MLNLRRPAEAARRQAARFSEPQTKEVFSIGAG
jgi:hypothetical protein